MMIIIYLPYFTPVTCFSKENGSADQVLLIQCSAKNVRLVLSIIAFCIRIYTVGQRLISFRLPCNWFGIIPVLDGTNCNIQTSFSCLILINSLLKRFYFGLSRLWCCKGCDVRNCNSYCVPLMVLSSKLIFFFRCCNFNYSKFWHSQHIISNYFDPGSS